MTDARAPEEAKELSRVARQIMWAGFPQTAEEILRAYATAQREAGRREGREEAAKAIGHTVHAAGCQFHAYEANVGRTCPDAAHVKPCAHCEERTAAIRAGAAETSYDPAFGDDRACLCGHPYYRHFDSYDSMRPIGCKYCDCGAWSAPKAGA